MRISTLTFIFVLGNALGALIPLHNDNVDIEKRTVEAPQVEQRDALAPLFKVAAPVKSRFIVVYKDDISDEDKDNEFAWISSLLARRDGADTLKSFDIASFRGYVGNFDDSTVERIRNSGAVKYVEEDAEVEASSITTENTESWGLARISSRSLPKDKKYIYDTDGGKGVTTYVVDSGVKTDDPDFEGRAKVGAVIAWSDEPDSAKAHGTHVAGTVGSKTWGVAKKVDIISVSVFNPSGKAYISDILKGFEYCIADHKQKVNAQVKGYRGATLNMSIGGVKSTAWTDGLNALVDNGIHAVVAAGNENKQACDFSPGLSKAITVGGIDDSDNAYVNMNGGSCVDINAPAVNVPSVGTSQSPTYMTGTSMASPHVAGLAAYYLSLQPGLGSEFSDSLVAPAELRKRLLNIATKDAISNLKKDTPNLLAYNGASLPGAFWL